jgi:hypothetical protein
MPTQSISVIFFPLDDCRHATTRGLYSFEREIKGALDDGGCTFTADRPDGNSLALPLLGIRANSICFCS